MNSTVARYLVAVGLFTMSTGMTRPMFPLFAAGLGVGVVLIGVLNSVGVAANAIVRPLSGRLADRYGRGSFVLGGLLFLVAGNIAYATAPGGMADAVLAVGSTAIGIGAAAFWPSLKASLVELYLHRRERALGYITTIQGICTALGAAVGGVVATGVGYRWSFGLGAGSLLIAAVLVGRTQQPTPRQPAEPPAEPSADASIVSAETVATRHIPTPVIVIAAATAVMNIAVGAILTFLSLYASQAYHRPASAIGLLFTFVFLGQAAGGYLIGTASGTTALRRIGRRRLLVVLLGLAVLCCVLTPMLGFVAFGAAQTVLAVLATSAGIVLMALSTELMSVNRLSTVIGTLEAVSLSASLLGPVLGGALFQTHQTAFFPAAGAAFAVALLLLLPVFRRLEPSAVVEHASQAS